jgi:hypothetical protein
VQRCSNTLCKFYINFSALPNPILHNSTVYGQWDKLICWLPYIYAVYLLNKEKSEIPRQWIESSVRAQSQVQRKRAHLTMYARRSGGRGDLVLSHRKVTWLRSGRSPLAWFSRAGLDQTAFDDDAAAAFPNPQAESRAQSERSSWGFHIAAPHYIYQQLLRQVLNAFSVFLSLIARRLLSVAFIFCRVSSITEQRDENNVWYRNNWWSLCSVRLSNLERREKRAFSLWLRFLL